MGCAFTSDWHADETAGMGDHKVDLIRRAGFRRTNQIAFVLTVLIVGNQNNFAITQRFQDVFDRIEKICRSLLLL